MITNSASRHRLRLSAEERREQIVTVATELVARHGFNGLSLQEVADGVGITQAGLLHYIGTKNGLLKLLLDSRYDRQGTSSTRGTRRPPTPGESPFPPTSATWSRSTRPAPSSWSST